MNTIKDIYNNNIVNNEYKTHVVRKRLLFRNNKTMKEDTISNHKSHYRKESIKEMWNRNTIITTPIILIQMYVPHMFVYPKKVCALQSVFVHVYNRKIAYIYRFMIIRSTFKIKLLLLRTRCLNT